MKIVHVITKSNWGGAQKYVYDVATYFGNEHDVSVISGQTGILTDRLYVENIHTHSLPHLGRDVSLPKDIQTFFNLIKLYRRIRPDVIHLNSSKIGGLGTLAARIAFLFSKHSPKIIFTAHGWAFNEMWRSKISRAIIFTLSYITTFLCHHTITLSQKEYNQMQRPLVKSKLAIIPIGLTPFTLIEQKEAREKLFPNGIPQQNIIGTIAELHSNKGIDIAIKAIRNISNIHYIIIGAGEQETYLQSLITKYNLKDKVTLFGPLKDAARYMNAFDIFLLPSRKEGLPYTLLEAGYAMRPTISTRVGGIPTLIKHEGNGLLTDPENISGLQKTICAMLDNPLQANNYGEELRETVIKSFTSKDMFDKIKSLYMQH